MAALPRHLLPRLSPPRLAPPAHGASHVHDSHVHDTPADAPPPAEPPATRPQLPLLSAILHDRVRAADVQTRCSRFCLPNPLTSGLHDCPPVLIRVINALQLALKRSRPLSMRQSIRLITE